MREPSVYYRPDLRIVFQASEYIGCVFLSLVVKIDSLNEKYPGGIKAFDQKHNVTCNRDLAVICAMALDDLAEAVSDLDTHGFVNGDDVVLFDAASDVLAQVAFEHSGLDNALHDYSKPDLGVNWLEGVIIKGKMMLRLVK